MNFKLSNLIIFAAGAIVGSFVTCKIIEKKYILKERVEEEEKELEEAEETQDSYEDIIEEYTKPKKVEVEKMYPYVISPEEFGEKDDYETVSLNYYADGVITDDQDYIIEDTDIIVDPEEHFGEYEDDTVFVRNDDLKIDYEILRDLRKYSDVFPEEE